MRIERSDVLVIGGGLAGLRTAIGVRRRGFDVVIASLVPAKRSHSKAAQGGMQASLANVTRGAGDNEDVHFADTVRGSDWGADQEVVRMFVHTAPKAVRELAAWGVPWSRVRRGDREAVINGERVTLTERDDAHGLIAQRDFGGTRKWRTCYVSDGTGHAMLSTMADQALAASIPVVERVEALALIHDGARCHGAILRDLITGEVYSHLARATVIATGGAGRLYRVTTNALINEGMGHTLALETGVAQLGNMEAVQFHPTGIFPAGILVTEGCRGDGGLLLDGNGHRFMPDYEPEKAELASRDVVSRRMEQHIAAGHGARTRFGEHLWLDITLLGEAHIRRNLREVQEICQYFLGIDPAREWIPVRPAQHYTMGGVRTKPSGESPTLAGLFAAGEAACWDMHGFNRLGGNSVAETVVAGMIVGEYVADHCERHEIDAPDDLIEAHWHRQVEALDGLQRGQGEERAPALLKAMQETMTNRVGIFRSGEELEAAVDTLQQLLERSRHLRVQARPDGPHPELVTAYRTRRMLKLALTIAQGALARTESRGAHYREDHPRRDDTRWLLRTLASWPDADAHGARLDYEALDVQRMEMPPGLRGYGGGDPLLHPLTEARNAEIARLREAHPDDDRHALQRRLMPFEHLLPERLRGPNERLDERLGSSAGPGKAADG